MRKLTSVVVGAVVLGLLSSCTAGTTKGCTAANCQRMLECRVELSGEPSSACWVSGVVPAGFDTSKYCVEACEHQGAGELVACIAARADRCSAATDSATKLQIAEECQSSGGGAGGGSATGSACSMQCDSERKACDAPCVSMLDAGFAVCADCSAECGQKWVDCTNRCGS
ncbi:MAG: hypothetical protein QM723_10090 [Myxococcaceae bacterium]